MIESRLSRFVKREVVAAPHAPHDLMHWVEHLFKASGTH